MKRIFLTIFLLLSAVFGYADVPKLLHYQGQVNDGQGIPLDGSHKLSFRLYDAQVQGNLLWQESFNPVAVTKGNFAVLLDVGTAAPALTFNQSYWLSIEVDDDGEMTPRQQIASSAYSINTSTVNGIPASTTAQANKILPLNAQGKFPQSVLDIQQGPGGNFNADTVDGFHASSTPTANTLLPLDSSAKVPLNSIPQDQGSGLNADKVDGKEASQLLDRANHTGVQPPSSISPQGSGSGLDADKVDGEDLDEIYNVIDEKIKILFIAEAGDSPVARADDEETNVSPTEWEKIKEIYVPLEGTLRIKFDMHGTGRYGLSQIYRNGVRVGTLQQTSNPSYQTYSEDIGGWKAGDLCQLYVRGDSGQTTTVRNFWICLNKSIYFMITDP